MVNLMSWVFSAHDEYAKSHHKRVRKWDGRTPYAVHPAWCALTLLTETALPEDLRVRGFKALLLHDILEDTNAGLPADLEPEVVALVEEMTFPGGSAEEMERVWGRSNECRLLKLYDKVSNLLDATWMSDAKRHTYHEYTLRLAHDVELEYGTLNIVSMARAICQRS